MTPLTVDFPIHFKHDLPGSAVASEKALRSSLTDGGQGELDTVIRWLQTGKDFSVQLTGMASIEGPHPHNTELGKNRVKSVSYVLVANGIGVSRFADPYGMPAACTEVGVGLRNCGDTLASTPKDEDNRQVRARMFIAPKGSAEEGKGKKK
jgi:hypothetical protein